MYNNIEVTDFEIDLQRVIWHEFGHLAIDIFMSKEIKEYHVDSVFFKYVAEAISTFKWSGGVTTLPTIKYNIFPGDLNKSAYSLLSLISGCVFQTIYLNEFAKVKTDYNDCFDMKENCAGYGDFYSFSTICSEHRKAHGKSDAFLKFEVELGKMFLDIVKQNQNFIYRINELAIIYSNSILELYAKCKNKNSFRLDLENKQLIHLNREIVVICNETGFTDCIKNTKKSIISTLEKNIADNNLS